MPTTTLHDRQISDTKFAFKVATKRKLTLKRGLTLSLCLSPHSSYCSQRTIIHTAAPLLRMMDRPPAYMYATPCNNKKTIDTTCSNAPTTQHGRQYRAPSTPLPQPSSLPPPPSQSPPEAVEWTSRYPRETKHQKGPTAKRG